MIISKYGIKIENISAGSLYDMNQGIRDYYNHTDAMLNNSLFSYFLIRNGMEVYKDESTRDIICLDFDFGSPSYEEEQKRLNKLFQKADDESKEKILKLKEKAEQNQALYCKRSRDEIREFFYENGVNITQKDQSVIHYEMLFRTSAKAKLGQVMFIKEALYQKAYHWLTIGLGAKMRDDNARIVELSAYAPLTTSTIIGTMHIPVEDILILKDEASYFETLAKVVKAQEYLDNKGEKKKKCIVSDERTPVKNMIWDGMALIDSRILPENSPDNLHINGMALLRNHLFKACAFKANIQLFFSDYCREHGLNYNTYQVKDMFGNLHYVKDIKMITTDNSIKWIKFMDLMGGTPESAYEYWCDRIRDDKNLFGIVKTDHPSKLGDYQQLSYQMINTLPCSKEDIKDIARISMDYVEALKNDNHQFEQFLRQYANEVNHYEMLADLYAQNPEFENSTFFRKEKSEIIKQYVFRLRKGKIVVNGDNLTVCGNPYGLLLYAAGADYTKDPTLVYEEGCVQCYTSRFEDEYLAAFRNPHNSPNNICYFHNVKHEFMLKYFDFSQNIVAVNCIHTDIQDRANGMDEDSDFMLVTNQRNMTKIAKECYLHYPTIVNALKESNLTYRNTKTDYADMDNKFSKSRMGIGYSSNLAQLAMTYYWTELNQDVPNPERLKELYDCFIILSVLAQVIIDGCKREYEIDGIKEIERISKLDCMSIKKEYGETSSGKPKYIKCDLPEFMKYTREIKFMKDGKELPQNIIAESKNHLKQRMNPHLVCPMNWLERCLDRIQNSSTTKTIPTSEFFIKLKGRAHDRQMSKILSLVVDYDHYIKSEIMNTSNDEETYLKNITEKSKEVLDKMSKIKIGNVVTINRLIELALGLDKGVGNSKKSKYHPEKYTRKILNLLYKTNKNKFLTNFKSPGQDLV